MNDNIKSLIFDFSQVTSIVLILLTGPIITSNIVFSFVQILAILILFEAAWEMKRTKYFRIPDIGKQNELVKSGIYKYIRNPMYLSQLLFIGILVVGSFNILRLAIMVIMSANFVFKIQYEEQLLGKYFEEFAEYKKSSWRLIPFLY